MQVGKYQLVTKLATGGMAEVFLAKAAGPMGFEKTLVLKRILPHMAEDPAFVEMFLAEAKLAAQLNHPNIVQIFDFGEAEGSYYLAMEYIDGPNLRTLAKRARHMGETLPPAMCARIIASACEGLAFAHAFADPDTGEPLGLIHRDISPDNIMVSRQGAVKVVDFGIAKAAGTSGKTQTGVVKGKLAYMPPEQVQGKNFDLRVDVYALGVVLYELLTGQRPYDATTDVSIMQAILFEPLIPVAERRPDLPEDLQRILERALAKSLDERYPDCHAFQADLERFAMSTGEPMGAYQMSQLIKRYTGEAGGPMLTPPPGTGSRGAAGTGSQARAAPPVSKAAAPPRPRPASEGMPSQGGSVSQSGSVSRVRPAPPPPRPTGADLQEPVGDFASRPTEMEASPITEESLAQEDLAAVRRRPAWLVPVIAGAVLLAAGGAVMGMRSSGGSVAPPPAAPVAQPLNAPPSTPQAAAVQPPPAAPVAAPTPDPAPPTSPPAAPVAVVEAPVAVPETPAAPEQAPARPTSSTSATKRPRPTGTTRRPAEGGNGTVEFRIRPYATVALDGKVIGQTPFAPIEVPEGRHTVRLVNRDLGKEITRTLDVTAGKTTIFKHNLLEE
ncbi:serine/threonine protein kinase [Myxococcaceae bacterium GXIMD 01537]